VIEAKAQEVKEAAEAALGTNSNKKSGGGPKQSTVPEVIVTHITAQQHEKLTYLIYNAYDFLDLVYRQIAMRIPEQA